MKVIKKDLEISTTQPRLVLEDILKSYDLEETLFEFRVINTNVTLSDYTVSYAIKIFSHGVAKVIEREVEYNNENVIRFHLPNEIAGYSGRVYIGLYAVHNEDKIDIKEIVLNMEYSIIDEETDINIDTYYETLDKVVQKLSAYEEASEKQIDEKKQFVNSTANEALQKIDESYQNVERVSKNTIISITENSQSLVQNAIEELKNKTVEDINGIKSNAVEYIDDMKTGLEQSVNSFNQFNIEIRNNINNAVSEVNSYATLKKSDVDNAKDSAIAEINEDVADVDSHATTTKASVDDILDDTNSYAQSAKSNMDIALTDVQSKGSSIKSDMDTAKTSIDNYATTQKSTIDKTVDDVNSHAITQKEAINAIISDVQSTGVAQKEAINNVLPDVQSTADTAKADINAVLPTVSSHATTQKQVIDSAVSDVNGYADSQKQAIDNIVSDVQSTGNEAKEDIKATLPTLQNQVSEIKEDLVKLEVAVENISGEVLYSVVNGYYVNPSNGSLLPDSAWSYTKYIDVGTRDKLIINSISKTIYNCFYDSDKALISSFTIYSGGNDLVIPSNAKYMIISNKTADISEMKIKVPKEEETLVSGLVELSENLFDKSSSNIMRDSIITQSGIKSASNSSVSDFIPVIKGKRYTTMYIDEWKVLENGDYDLANLVSYSRNYVAFYDDNKTFIGTSNSEPYQAPLIPDKCKYIRVAYETAKENQFMVVPDHIVNPQVMHYSSYEKSNIVEMAKERLNDSLINGIARLGYNVTGIDTPPQQTIESFDLACEYGFNVLLADCNFTSDNVPVCFHDKYIGSNYQDIPLKNDGSMIQNADHTIGIYSKTYNEWVREYDFGLYKGEKYRGTKLLTVEEFVRYCKFKGKRCYLEVKVELTNEQTEIIANILKKYNMEELVTVATDTSPSNVSAMVYLEELCPKLKRVAFMPQYLNANSKSAFSIVKKDGVEVVWFGWSDHNLTTEEVDYLVANNITYENGSYDNSSAMIKWLNTAENKYCSGIESGRIPANIALSKKAGLLN